MYEKDQGDMSIDHLGISSLWQEEEGESGREREAWTFQSNSGIELDVITKQTDKYYDLDRYKQSNKRNVKDQQ